MIQDLLNITVYEDKALGDFLTIEFLSSLVGSVLAAAFLLFVGFIIAAWAGRRVRKLGRMHAQLDYTLFTFLGNILRYTIITLTLIIVLNTFGVQTTSIVAVVGAAGLAIGLALQGTLSNIAAGVMIVFFRPINVGDFVEVGGEMGTVKDISLNFTELASLSNVQIIVPNSEVWGNVITNYSTYDMRRAEWQFSVGYGENLQHAEDIIRDTLMADQRSKAEPEPFIKVDKLNESSVDFLVRCWVSSAEYFDYQADIKRAVKEALDEGGIEIPFPTRTMVQPKST